MKSWEVMDWAFKQSVKGPRKLVLLCLGHHWNEKEKASWPGLSRIAQETSLGRRTVIRVIDRLEKLKLIGKATREGSHGQNRYTLSIPSETSVEVNSSRSATRGTSTEPARSANGDARSAIAVAPKPLSSEPLSLNRNNPSAHSGEAVRLTSLLNDLIGKNIPKRTLPTKSKLKEWLRVCEKIHRIDQHSWEDIEETIRWSQQHKFWRTNILSMENVRSKWDKLRAQMDADGEVPYSGPPRPGIDCPSVPVAGENGLSRRTDRGEQPGGPTDIRIL